MVDLRFLRIIRREKRRLEGEDEVSLSKLQEGCKGEGGDKTSFLGDRRDFLDEDFVLRAGAVDALSSIEELLRCLCLWCLCFECLWGDLDVCFCLEFFFGLISSD